MEKKRAAGRLAAVRAVLFVLLFAILLEQASEILRYKVGGNVHMIRSFYDEKPQQLDVLCLGSSHAYYSFQPNVLWHDYGLTSYVMGTPQQSIACSYYLLKEALRTQSPKAVFLETYYLRIRDEVASDARLRVVADNMRWGGPRKEILEHFTADRPWKERVAWYLPFVYYHERWNALVDVDFHYVKFAHGTKFVKKRKAMTDLGTDCKPVDLPEFTRLYLDKMIELCREHGIALILYSTPFGAPEGTTEPTKTYANTIGVNRSLKAYLEERGIPFLFLQEMPDNGIDFSMDYKDPGHLNAYGMEKVTRLLGDYLAENVPMASHRDDPAYAKWEEDYKAYRKVIKERKDG